jgi:hypothetical protein
MSGIDHEAYLRDRQKDLAERWFNRAMDTYPVDSAKFFKSNKDPFANPVGNTLNRSIGLVCAEVIKKKMNPKALQEALEPIVRIRAVQEFSAADALSFLLDIKPIIREALTKRQGEKGIDRYLALIESNTDTLLLMAFDSYMKCRQKVYSLRINQAKEGVKQLLIKKGLISELPDFSADLRDACASHSPPNSGGKHKPVERGERS